MEDMITMCKVRATEAMNSFLHALSFVPADKLNWSPTPTAKSAFQIAAHCAGYSGAFAVIIRAGKFLPIEEFLAMVQSAIDGIATLEQAEAVLRKGIAETIAALDTVKPEQIDSMIEAPSLGQTPFTFFMTLPAYHLDGHTAQIDYLQTCWDDQEVHLQ
jgi:hypothetical protein